MSIKTSNKDLLDLVHELANRRGIAIPTADPFPEQDFLFHAFLRERFGLDPKLVDPILDIDRLSAENRVEIHAQLLLALTKANQISDEELRAILFIALQVFSETRASSLIRTISEPLVSTARRVAQHWSPDYAIGVFPMQWFNGQYTTHDDSPLFLISAGSIDLIETFFVLLSAFKKDPRYAVQEMRAALDHYAIHGAVEKPAHGLAKGLVDFGTPVRLDTVLTTSTEQFLLAHEFGHMALNHQDAYATSPLHTYSSPEAADRIPRKEIEAITPSHFDEHCADVWALLLTLKCAEQKQEEHSIAFACAGAVGFMGIALLVEHFQVLRGVDIRDSHPNAADRLYQLDLCIEVTSNSEHRYVAQHVKSFVESVGRGTGKFEMPPMLSREQNRTAIAVFTYLGVDLSDAPYITDFT